MTIEEERLAKIEEIFMKHKGKKNAINAREIAKIVSIPDNDTFVITRMLIRKLVKNKQLPIGADKIRGYFIIETQKELSEYIKELEKRMIGMTDRKARVIRYFENYHDTEYTENEEFDEDEEEAI